MLPLNNIRLPHPWKEWYKGVWFSYATPNMAGNSRSVIHGWSYSKLEHGTKSWLYFFAAMSKRQGVIFFFYCQSLSEIWRTLTQRLLANDWLLNRLGPTYHISIQLNFSYTQIISPTVCFPSNLIPHLAWEECKETWWNSTATYSSS